MSGDPFADIRALAEAALSKVGPWCGVCGEAFSTREPELARFAMAVMEVLGDRYFLERASVESLAHDDMGADIAKSIRAAIARKLETTA